jgi:putative DNA primase/helicase
MDRPTSPRPVALPVSPDRIPSDLKASPQFVGWRYELRDDKWTKPPICIQTGEHASSTDPKTWTTSEIAILTYRTDAHELDGIGYVLIEADEIVGFDFDHCRNPDTGEIDPWALELIHRLNSYTEVSPSGTGLRTWTRGTFTDPKQGRKRGDLEMYRGERYLTLTGCHLEDTPPTIERRQEAIDAIYQQFFRRPERPRGEPHTNGYTPNLEDATLLEKALNARNGGKLARLLAGDIRGYPSASEADLALCCMLAFWTTDSQQIEQLVRGSALFREKWERPDYRDATITKALASTTEHWSPPQQVHTSSTDTLDDDVPNDEDRPPPIESNHETIVGDPQTPLPYSDQTNAETLVRWYGRDIRYCNEFKQWLFWDGHRWAYDTTQHVMRLAKATIKRLAAKAETLDDEAAKALLAHVKASLSASRLKAMVSLAESEPGVAIKPAELDQNRWLLNCRNGTIDLRTGKLHPHRREDWLTKCMDIDYNPNATCPNWLAFLWRVMDGPLADEVGHEAVLLERHDRAEHLVQFLQRAVGYSLTGVIAEHVLFFLYGGGQNGKSTFSETLAPLFGEYFQKAPTHLLMLKERTNLGAPSPELARLFGVRLVMACEVGEGQRLNETQVKDLTGDDIIVARNLYQGFIEFRPTYKLWMYGNHKPTINGTDEAIWRRPKLIPFTVKIPDEEVNPFFRERCLLPELPGILAWAIEGCLAWQREGLQVPDVVAEATRNYRREMDVMGQFIDDCCACIPDASVKASAIYAEYCKWCETNHEVALKQRNFGLKLSERGFTSAKGTGGTRLWKGIGLARPSGLTSGS